MILEEGLILPVFVFITGLFIGSFLNVCIYRIPKEESVVAPRSKCTNCGRQIRAWDNIPVLSYLFLLGKCRDCGTKISIRYPIVELISALMAIAVFYLFGPTLPFIIYYAWICVLIVVTFIDLDYQIIPDRFSLGGIVAGLVLVYWLPISYKDALIGLVAGGGSLLAVIYAYYLVTKKEGMGMGDVKLLGMIGVFIGWKGVLFTIFAASLIGSIVGIIWILVNRKNMKAAIPFGPFLSIGAILYLFYGQQIIDFYMSLKTQ